MNSKLYEIDYVGYKVQIYYSFKVFSSKTFVKNIQNKLFIL